jgi:hypothetical protein
MLDPKTAGAYLAGRHMGKVAGKIEAEGESIKTLAVHEMTIDKLRDRVGSERARLIAMTENAGFYLAHVRGTSGLFAVIQAEGAKIASHMAKFGSMTDAEMKDLAPVTFERRHSDREMRPLSRRISKEAAIAFVASEAGQKDIFAGLEFSPAERARILERVRAEIEKET